MYKSRTPQPEPNLSLNKGINDLKPNLLLNQGLSNLSQTCL